MAIYWNASGNADNAVAKPLATLGLPLFGIATVAFVRLGPDSLASTPGGETVSILFLGVVFVWVETLVLVWNLGYRFNVALATLPVVVLAAGLVWYALRRSAGGQQWASFGSNGGVSRRNMYIRRCGISACDDGGQ